ncbi:MAG: DUF393 domain-containing protein [Rhizobiales bacterium]|nr:DUF393 domain-containing protein [Hyphomicrobiales bacterium]
MDFQPFSYRADPAVPPFPDDRAVLFFDGVCVLCSGFARFVMRHDNGARIRLCAAQSPLGQAIYRHYGLDPVKFETNILLARGRPYFKSETFIETMSILGGVHSVWRLLRLCPVFIRDRLYDPIARNRYRWFGERNACYVPGPDDRGRFLE